MNPTAVLLQTNQFSAEWRENPDQDPPPGHELADALLKQLRASGAESQLESLPSDWFEHSNWYFSVTWRIVTYDFRVELSLEETVPPTWMISFAKSIGVLHALFGKRERCYDVDPEFTALVEMCVATITGIKSLAWITEDEATNIIYGIDKTPLR
jgi:hypothetical protein